VKVLLDENLAHRLRKKLGAHEVLTVSFKGWAGLKNGELLRIAEENGIEVFVTGDQTLSYEQNLKGRAIAIVELSSVEWDVLKNHLPSIITAIDRALPGTFQAVDCGTFSRKK
jgi:predicted nuclease of predicted toxin-antitoxin system